MPFDTSKFRRATDPPPSNTPPPSSRFSPPVNVPEETPWYLDPRIIGATLIRGLGGLAPGGPIGAGVGAVTEGLAQTIEDKPYNVPNIAGAAAIGAIPFGKAASIAKTALKSGAMSAGSTALRQQTEEGLHLPNIDESKQIALSGGLGTVIGAGAAKLTSKIDYSKFTKATAKEAANKEVAKAVAQAAETPIKTVPKASVEELQAHAPRFSIGSKSFEPQWKNDTDKALFVISQSGKKHKFHDDYMGFLTKTTGLGESDLQAAGKELREKLRIYLKDQKIQGDITVPKFNTFKIKPGKPRASFTGAQEIPTVKAEISTDAVPQVDLQTAAPSVNLEDDISRLKVTETPDKATEPLTWRKNWFRKAAAEVRQGQTGLDLSFPFRQGITNVSRKEFKDAILPMLKSAWKEENFEVVQKEVRDHPAFELMQKAGLEFSELGKNAKNIEEALSKDTLLEQFVGKGNFKPFRMSNRAYMAMGNKLRKDLFVSMADDAKKAGVQLVDADGKITENARAIGRYINSTTGRGHLGQLEKNASILNDVFFSPKLMASRIDMFKRAFKGVGSYAHSGMLEQGIDTALAKQLRKRALRDMGAVGGLAATTATASALMGAKGTLDPRSTDAGKFKLGNTRFDMTGGFQQYLRAATQLATGQASVEGDVKDRNRLNTAIRFGRNKLSPIAGLIVDFLADKNVLGDEFEWDEAAKSRAIPLIIQDLMEVSKEEGVLPGIAATIPGAFGVGVQSYGKTSSNSGSSSKGSSSNIFKMPKVKLN